MDFSKLITISNKEDIFFIVNQKTDGIIAKSLMTDKASFFSSRKSKIMFLQNIEVFSTEGLLYLPQIFEKIQKTKEKIPTEEAEEKHLDEFYKNVEPTINLKKMSLEDKKKILKWFQILDNKSVTFG